MSIFYSGTAKYTSEMDKISNRKSFIVKVSLILFLLLIMVIITGTYAYRQFTGVLEGISEKARPDARLLTAEALQNDLQDAELSIKSYSLTNDSIFIKRFHNARTRTFYRLNKLYVITNRTSSSPIKLDSLDTLIHTKVQILEDLLLLHDKYHIDSALSKVMSNAEFHVKSNGKEKKQNFLNWLFRRENNTSKDSTLNKISLTDLENEVREIQQESALIEAAIKSKEMELIIKDRQISERIEMMLNTLRESELKSISHESKIAAETIDQTKKQIALFSIAIGLLVLFMAYIFMNYIRGSRKYKRAIGKARSEAEDLAYTKERFLANMSHEMRTPMNAISGFTEQISQGPLNKEQKEQIGMVKKSADHLLYLINEILDFSKLQAKRLKLEIIGFKPKELIDDLEAFMRRSVEKKDLHVTIELDDDIPEVLLGDPYRLRQILLNLVSNSIKFTDEGGIQIKAETEKEKNKKNKVTLKIEVIDTGIGMNDKQLKKVFKEFVQAESTISRTYGGTGLGLAIVKMLVDLHGGRIKITSEPNVGTCVELEIPYEVGSLKDLAIKKDDQKIDLSVDLSELKIMIVDDELFNRQLLTNILDKHNAQFKEASNGKKAIELAKKEKFDVILMDARMPEMNGVEATKIIRKSDCKSNNTPIIALTAAVTEEDRVTYKKAGMDGFLAKPYQEVELLAAIENVLNPNKSSVEELKKSNNSSEITNNNGDDNQLDFDELNNIAMDDEAFYLDMLKTFVDGTNEGIKEMREDLKNEEWIQLADHAHKIASPAGHLGASELRKILKDIEQNCRDHKQLNNIEDKVNKAIELAQKAVSEAHEEIKKTKSS